MEHACCHGCTEQSDLTIIVVLSWNCFKDFGENNIFLEKDLSRVEFNCL